MFKTKNAGKLASARSRARTASAEYNDAVRVIDGTASVYMINGGMGYCDDNDNPCRPLLKPASTNNDGQKTGGYGIRPYDSDTRRPPHTIYLPKTIPFWHR